ncbi:MAG TPA: CvpA family protein [Candidatus Binatia bacterium]|nr:CvpA family protein [Candidatus Binatia bacterium]
MILVDWCLLAVLAVSVVIGVFRGFVREILGLVTWAVAVVATLFLAAPASAALEGHIGTPSLRVAAGYALVFFGVLLTGSIVTHLVAMAVRKSVLSGFDRAVGGAFGLVRGVLLALAFVWLAGKTPMRQDGWWSESLLVGRLDALVGGVAGLLPSQWGDALRPDAGALPEAT